MFVPNSFIDGSAGGTPITAATLNNLELGLVAADVTNPASAAALSLSTTYAMPRGGLLVGLGDSIPAAGDNASAYFYADSYNLYAAMLSGGRVQYVQNAGVGGNTTSMMLARFDTDVTPYAPSVVTFNGGTNDFTFGVSDTTYRANVKALVAKIRAIKATPIIFTPMPVSGAGAVQKAQIARNVNWCIRYGLANQIQVVDALSVLVDQTTDGNYATANTRDGGTHPSNLGHYILGQALASLFVNMPVYSTLAKYTSDPNNLVVNGMMQGSGATAPGWDVNSAPSSGTWSAQMIADSAWPGGMKQRLTLTGAIGNLQLHQHTTIATGFAVGDLMEISCMVSNTVGVRSVVNVGCNGSSGNPANLFEQPVTQGQVVRRFIVPAGTIGLDVTIAANSPTNTIAVTGNVDYSGVTLRNLTAEGSV